VLSVIVIAASECVCFISPTYCSSVKRRNSFVLVHPEITCCILNAAVGFSAINNERYYW